MDYAEQLKAAQTTITIPPAPLILEKVGATWRGMYLGLRTFSKTDPNTGEVKILPVAHFYDGAGVLFNMGTQMVHSVAVLRPGTSIEIALREMKPNKGKEGKTKIYSISPLDIPVANMNELFGGMLNISAPAPISPIRAALGYKRLPSKTYLPIPTIPRLDRNAYFINYHRNRRSY